MRIQLMKNVAIICAAMVIFAGIAATASAGERAVPKSTLASMGFASAHQMSDTDGLAVRGKGTSASVMGTSTANYSGRSGDATSTNAYMASADHHSSASSANGSSLSFAGNVSGSLHHVHFNVIFAGGNATASAH
jgi:hypothetical protein